MRYAFIGEHSGRWPVRWLCSLLDVHPSGFYAWQRQPRSARAVEDERLSGLIKQFWLESGAVYGYRKIHSDLREHGERCGPNRVHRLMRGAGIRAQVGYRRPRHKAGRVHKVTPNVLQRQFNPTAPNAGWVTGITHIRTHEGWLYLAVVLDLFSRRVIGMVHAVTDLHPPRLGLPPAAHRQPGFSYLASLRRLTAADGPSAHNRN